jgi:hypothetical protein
MQYLGLVLIGLWVMSVAAWITSMGLITQCL